ncbi:DsbA family protein [Neiella marina]|uniref:DsbA family protein n=1 Tax=Neiella holothuriorum TaxID=2870530 RepID=A0ABS7ECK5_9GAMM|nr:DsbA family protein [Neiella holothuriorum]MBW8190071.1 DsbA family protein [Neiella holothuriorum]
MACINRLIPLKGGVASPLLLIICLLSWPVKAIESFQAGTHYRVLVSELQNTPEQAIELEYWFWFGCASCQLFNQNLPRLQAEDTAWQQIPAQLRSSWYFHAKGFYVAQQQPQAEQLLAQLEQTLAADPTSLSDIDSLTAWFVEQGVELNTAEQQLLSPLLNEQLEQQVARQQALEIRGVPTLIIGGQYLIDAGMVSSLEEYLAVAEYLLGLVRQQREEAGFAWPDEELLPAEPVAASTH